MNVAKIIGCWKPEALLSIDRTLNNLTALNDTSMVS